MPASVTETRGGGDVSAPDMSERTPLTTQSDSATLTYGTASSPTSSSHTEVDPDDTDESPLGTKYHHDDEEALLATTPPPGAPATETPQPVLSTKALLWIIAPMLLAVFISNADGTIVMATHAVIASDFMSLKSSSWLFTGFMLASTATQTTLGQLSGIFGRKPVMIVSYFVFGLGLLITGTAGSMTIAVLGRLLSGAVSAGNNVLVTLVVTDLLPVREVAAWRSYINVMAVLGRSVGGPLGGWLADMIGWRLSFIGQAPLFLLTLILCWISLPNTKPKQRGTPPHVSSIEGESSSTMKKLGQVDFLGSVLLAACLILTLVPIEFGGSKIPWSDPRIPTFFGLAGLALVLFIAAEKRRSSNQLLPLNMFRSRHIVASMLIIILQVAAQLGMLFTVPLYFQVTQNLSSTQAGARLVPSVTGNAIGGIVAGILIRKTGQYKRLVFLAAAMSTSAYVLLILRWHGDTNGWETLYIFPGGFGTGVTLSAVFVAVQVSVDKAHIIPAVSMVYLSQGLGAAMGLAGSSAVFQAGLRSTLDSRLIQLHLDTDMRNEIISNAVSSLEYVRNAKGDIASAIVASYVDGLSRSHCVSLLASVLAFTLAILLREYKL